MWLEKALKLNKKLGNQVDLAAGYNNIASIYQAQGDLPQAIAYFEKSLAIVAYTKDPQAIQEHVVSQEWFQDEEVIVLD